MSIASAGYLVVCELCNYCICKRTSCTFSNKQPQGRKPPNSNPDFMSQLTDSCSFFNCSFLYQGHAQAGTSRGMPPRAQNFSSRRPWRQRSSSSCWNRVGIGGSELLWPPKRVTFKFLNIPLSCRDYKLKRDFCVFIKQEV